MVYCFLFLVRLGEGNCELQSFFLLMALSSPARYFKGLSGFKKYVDVSIENEAYVILSYFSL